MKRPPLALSEAGTKAIVLITCAGCAGVVLAVPRAVPPSNLPPLSLDSGEVSRVLGADQKLARSAPSSESTKALIDVYEEQGRAELQRGETARGAELRARKMRIATATVLQRHGARGLAALRARAAEAFSRRLEEIPPSLETDAFVGSFPRMLERYGLVRDEALVAPRFVARTLFKARWNAIVQRPLTDGLEAVELQAYWGWLALGALHVEPNRRIPAVEGYSEAGGKNATEARAVLAYETGQLAASADLFADAYSKSGNLRLRNHALAALRAAAEASE